MYGPPGLSCAARLLDIDNLIRAGHLDAAIERLAYTLHCADTGDWPRMLAGLRSDGLVPEADLLEAMVDAPDSFGVITRARMIAAAVTVIPTFALGTQMGILALLPGLSLALLVYQVACRRLLRRATRHLPPARRAMVGDAVDLTTYLAGDLHLTRWVTLCCVLLAAGFVWAGVHVADTWTARQTPVISWALVASGALLLIATVRARAHVRDLEFRRPFPSYDHPIAPHQRSETLGITVDPISYHGDLHVDPLARRDTWDDLAPATPPPAPTPPEPPIHLVLPTPGRTGLTFGLIALAGLVAIVTVGGPIVTVASVVVVTLAFLRAMATSISVQDTHITVFGMFGARTYPIAEIRSARSPTSRGGNRHVRANPQLVVVFVDETVRTLATTGPFSTARGDLHFTPESRAGRIMAAAERINTARRNRR